MALRRIGADFEHWRVVEFDKYAIASYNAVHGTNFPAIDICDVHGADLGVTDTENYCYILTYSFPCTDISNAGLQAGMAEDSDTRSGLLWQVRRILSELDELPQVLVMENVKNIVSKRHMSDFQKWCDTLSSFGYKNYWNILNAKDYGVPQNRQRCFMVSLLGDYYFNFPKPTILTKVLNDILEDDVDERYYNNTEKARKLILKLIDQTDNSEAQSGCDYCLGNPSLLDVANCVTTKDYGIVNVRHAGTGV